MKLVLCTTPNRDSTKQIATALLDGKLAACVTVLPQVQSWYRWKGNLEESSEELLLIKLPDEKVPAAFEAVSRFHPYEVPEWIVLSPAQVSPLYEKWVNALE